MTLGRNIRIACLFTLCAFASAFGQTTSETQAPSAQEIPPHVSAEERGPLALRFIEGARHKSGDQAARRAAQ